MNGRVLADAFGTSDESGRLPAIDVSAQPREVVAAAWSVVLGVNDPPRVFRRAAALVELVGDMPGSGLVDARGDGLRIVTKDMLAALLVEHADWVRGDRNAQPPDFVVRMMLAHPHPCLPSLDHITSVPAVSPQGRIVWEVGYHPETRMYLRSGEGMDIGVVPDEPTSWDIVAARTLLLEELLGEFPFSGPSDLAHALAAVLLPFVRSFLGDCCTPLHLLTAATPGSGKSLLAQVVSYIAANQPPVITTLNSSDGETRKKLTSLLLRAAPIIVLDNLGHGVLDSPSLASVLTASVWTDRLLGHSRALGAPNQTVWLATGNNPRLSMELARRTVRICLDSCIERPWLRTGFRHADLLGWVRESRGRLIRGCLTLIQAWLAAGRPAGNGRLLGSFESWSRVLGGILEVAEVPGFLDDLDKLYSDIDAEGEVWRVMTRLWLERFGERHVRVSDVLPLCLETELFEDILGQGSERSQKSRLGHALQRCTGRVFSGLRIEKDTQAMHNSGRYRLRQLPA